jgi:hypothetical protein
VYPGVKKVSFVLMGTGFSLIALGGIAAFVFNSNQSWMIVGGWAIGILGVPLYVYSMIKAYGQNRDS